MVEPGVLQKTCPLTFALHNVDADLLWTHLL